MRPNRILILIYSILSAVLYTCINDTGVPDVITHPINSISRDNVDCGGFVSSDGGKAITGRGICYSLKNDPSVSDNIIDDTYNNLGKFVCSITDLLEDTVYYYRAYAENSNGTGYGQVMTFRTFNGTITDIDGNIYNTVKTGTQIWMVENLKVTRFRNGDPIPEITDAAEWMGFATGAYCSFNNDQTLVNVYGRLYNLYAVSDIRNICPSGWHIPALSEWQTMISYLGGEEIAGGKMKETGFDHWTRPNTGATNETGFTGLPGGVRNGSNGGQYNFLNYEGAWWSSTMIFNNPAYNWSIYLNTNNPKIEAGSGGFDEGYSIRCVKNK